MSFYKFGMKIFLPMVSQEGPGAGRRHLPTWHSSSIPKIKPRELHDAVPRLSWDFFFFSSPSSPPPQFLPFFFPLKKCQATLGAGASAGGVLVGSRDPRATATPFSRPPPEPALTSQNEGRAGPYRLGPAVAMVFAVAGHVPRPVT